MRHFCISQIELDCLKNQNRYSNPLFLFAYIFVVHLCDILCNLTEQNAVATKIFDKQKKEGVAFFLCSIFDFMDSHFIATIRTAISAGETPDIRDACPRLSGLISESFCLASMRSALIAL